MKDCPGVDRLWATQLGISLIIAFCFVSSISYYSLGYFIHSEVARISIALLIASVVALFDRALFQSDWFHMGLIQHVREEIRIEQTTQAKLLILARYCGRILLRLGVSLLIAFTLSLFVEVAVFGDAISEKIDANFRRENSDYYARLKAQTNASDDGIAVVAGKIATIEAQIGDRRQRVQAAMNSDDRRIYDRDWQAIKDKDAEIKSLQVKIDENDKSIRAWRDDIQAEINGVKLKAEHTGLSGCGPVCETKKGFIQNADRENAEWKARQTLYRKEVQELDKRLSEIVAKYESADKAFVEERRREREELKQELAALSAGREAKLSKIEGELKQAGIFRERRDDPIIRVRYLKELKDDRERGDVVSEISLMIKLFMMFLEIAPVVGKMFFSPPSPNYSRLAGGCALKY